MIIVYHGIRPYEQTRHRGLFEAYARHDPVVYVDPMNVKRADVGAGPVPGAEGLGDVRQPGIHRARLPWLLPGGRLRSVSLAHRWLALRSLMGAISRKARDADTVLVTQQPDFLPTMRGLGASLTVYEVRDDYVGLTLDPVAKRRMRRAHARMLRASDLVVAISDRLVDDIRPVRPDVELTGVGVDASFFSASSRDRAPAGLASLPRPCIGLVGNLNDRVDWELLETIARMHREWSIAIVGPLYHASPAAVCAAERLSALTNVHMPGPIPEAEMPAAIAAMDVCLIPYRVSEAVERINPLKLYQYLAGGKPVVSTAIPAVRPFADVVGWARTHEEFLAAIEAALAHADAPASVRARKEVAERFGWATIADHQRALFQNALARRSSRA